MKTYKDLYNNLCSYENLFLAYEKARKGKTKKDYVIRFENNLEDNLKLLRTELLLHCYKPKKLKTFILRDPKTRKISKSHFRDRIIHHALINILEPIYDKIFIFDSYASRKNKGAHKAIKRLIKFQNKITKNGKSIFSQIINVKQSILVKGYVLKADIRHYFEEMDHNILLDIITRKIKDKKVIWLINLILKNFNNSKKGIPLGNYTSQFFANVYLNELDQFVKHQLKAKYYIRYVDDFVILHDNKKQLELWKDEIDKFLKEKLRIELHSQKSKIKSLYKGLDFLGFRIFQKHILLRKRNIIKIKSKIKEIRDYDKLMDSVEGFLAYSNFANCYKLKLDLMKDLDYDVWYKDVNRYIKIIQEIT